MPSMTPQNWPRKAWAARLNLSGLWSAKPVRVYRHSLFDPFETPYEYWDRSGDLCIPHLGVEKEEGWVSFSSEDRAEVEAFIDEVRKALLASSRAASKMRTPGAKAVGHLLERLSQ